jgi:single-strand DNA-binding protein
MASLNKVTLIGYIGKQPEIKSMDNGNKVASLSLATTEAGYALQNGTQVPERTDWHNVIAWGAIAGIIERYAQKGNQVYVEGRLRTRNYEDKNKTRHYITEIMCEKFLLLSGNSMANKQQKSENGTDVSKTEENAISPTKTSETDTMPVEQDTDDLPF